jgi:hypothetical protein
MHFIIVIIRQTQFKLATQKLLAIFKILIYKFHCKTKFADIIID